MVSEEARIRDMIEEDINDILSIDKGIIGEQRVVTYRNPKSTYLGGELGLSKVAEVDGKVVGFAIGRVMAHPYRLEDTGFLSLVGVHPDFQRKGIGARLVKAFVTSCQAGNIGNVHTLIDLNDRPMLGFFESLDFQKKEVAEFTASTQAAQSEE